MTAISTAVELAKLLFGAELRVGEPVSSGPLTLVPLFGAYPPRAEYLVASEAFAAGVLRITELGGGVVPQLVARNDSALPVLLVEGDHLVGARQNRIMNASALIAPKHETVLPVSCVEQGRWQHGVAPYLAVAPEMAFPRLRAANRVQVAANLRAGLGHFGDQHEVWTQVGRRHAEVAGVPSVTGAMGDAYRARHDLLTEMLAAFPTPLGGQTGVVACLGGRPVAMDAFGRQQTMRRMWERLLRGYAMEALGVPDGPRIDRAVVEAFLRQAAGGQATVHEGIGLGVDVVLTGTGVVCTTLVWQEGVVHASALATNTWDNGPAEPDPASRRRSFFHDPRPM